MKNALPPDKSKNQYIASEARETMQDCVSDFVNFITLTAIERRDAAKR